jgi:MraZ protein
MFLGEFAHSVDNKGRIALPAKFRPSLDGGLVVTRGFERCLQVYPLEQWQTLSERVSNLSLGNSEARALRRLLFGSAFDTELDKQGRMLIPASLREYAEIGDAAMIIGMNTYCEIWSQDAWAAVQHTLDDSASSIAEQMAALGI